jgi:hypothetical protein
MELAPGFQLNADPELVNQKYAKKGKLHGSKPPIEKSSDIRMYPKALRMMTIFQPQNWTLGSRNRNADSDKDHSTLTDQLGWVSYAGQIECESIRA